MNHTDIKIIVSVPKISKNKISKTMLANLSQTG
jgi:hypothetical protein